MSGDPRTRMAAEQYALVAALIAGAKTPPGFDETRIQAQARALVAKRQRVACAHHPWLADALGPDYATAFADYARAHPLPVGRAGGADAEEFEAYLRDRGKLPGRPRGRFLRWSRAPWR